MATTSQEGGEMGRVAALPLQATAALDLDGATKAALQAAEKRAGCKAGFSEKPKQIAPGFLVEAPSVVKSSQEQLPVE